MIYIFFLFKWYKLYCDSLRPATGSKELVVYVVAAILENKQLCISHKYNILTVNGPRKWNPRHTISQNGDNITYHPVHFFSVIDWIIIIFTKPVAAIFRKKRISSTYIYDFFINWPRKRIPCPKIRQKGGITWLYWVTRWKVIICRSQWRPFWRPFWKYACDGLKPGLPKIHLGDFWRLGHNQPISAFWNFGHSIVSRTIWQSQD